MKRIFSLLLLLSLLENTFNFSPISAETTTPISNCDITELYEEEYTGEEIEPDIYITSPNGISLQEDIDYTVKYFDNIKVGTASVEITGIGNYSGTQKINFTICKAQSEIDCKLKLFESRHMNMVQYLKYYNNINKAFKSNHKEAKLKFKSSDKKIFTISKKGDFNFGDKYGVAYIIASMPETKNYSSFKVRIPVINYGKYQYRDTVKAKKINKNNVIFKWKESKKSNEYNIIITNENDKDIKNIYVNKNKLKLNIKKFNKNKEYYIYVVPIVKFKSKKYSYNQYSSLGIIFNKVTKKYKKVFDCN